MNYRPLGHTGWKVSEVSFGAWAIGGSWGHVSDEDAAAALGKAVELDPKAAKNFPSQSIRGRVARP